MGDKRYLIELSKLHWDRIQEGARRLEISELHLVLNAVAQYTGSCNRPTSGSGWSAGLTSECGQYEPRNSPELQNDVMFCQHCGKRMENV